MRVFLQTEPKRKCYLNEELLKVFLFVINNKKQISTCVRFVKALSVLNAEFPKQIKDFQASTVIEEEDCPLNRCNTVIFRWSTNFFDNRKVNAELGKVFERLRWDSVGWKGE